MAQTYVGPFFNCSARGSSSADVQKLLAVLSPEQILDVSHIRWLVNTVEHCCPFLRESLEDNRTWIEQTKLALHNMLQELKQTEWAEVHRLSASDFIQWARQHRGQLQSFARHFGRKVRAKHLAVHNDVLRVFQARTQLFASGGFFGSIKARLAVENVVCSACGAAFANKAACASHRRRIHGQQGTFAGVCGTFCFRCGTEFHTTPGLRLHLRKVAGRGACYLGSDVDFTPAEFVDEVLLSDRPASKTAFARLFWATLWPSEGEHEVGDPVRHVAIRSFHSLHRCRSFQEVLHCLLTFARHHTELLEGARLAICSIGCELKETEQTIVSQLP